MISIELTGGYITVIAAELPEHLQWVLSVRWYAHKSNLRLRVTYDGREYKSPANDDGNASTN